MILACPECKTNFVVDHEQISTNGRRVKCSKCKHIWIPDVQVQGHLDGLWSVSWTEYGVRLTTFAKSTYGLVLGSMALTALLFVAAQALYPKTMEKAGLCPMCNHKGLTVENVQIEYDKNNNKLSLHHDLSNQTDHAQKMPPILISIFDEQGSLIEKKAVEDNELMIPAKQSVNPFITFDAIPSSASAVEVNIGHSQFFWFKD